MISVVRKQLVKGGIDVMGRASQDEAFHSFVRALLAAERGFRRRIAFIVITVHGRSKGGGRIEEQGRVSESLKIHDAISHRSPSKCDEGTTVNTR